MLEFFTTLAVLSVIFFMLSIALDSSRRLNHYQFEKQRCLAAARSNLDSIDATGQPISNEKNQRLWPKVAITIDQADGTGQFEGLTLVSVTAKTRAIGKYAKITLSRYRTSPMER